MGWAKMWLELLYLRLSGTVRRGQLTVISPKGDSRHFGSGSPHVTVRLLDPNLPRKLMLNPELALGEGYMEGTLDVGEDDLYGLLWLLMTNVADHRRLDWRRPETVLALLLRHWQQLNPKERSQRNVAHHYDLSDDLYRAFLDRDLQYSCGYFRSPDDDLDRAQAQKKCHVARKLLLQPGMRVLDIGCGWGGLALTLARDFGARVTGITLSQQQLTAAKTRAEQTGLTKLVDFRLMDYRTVSGTYDRIVSVGMLEHVGAPQFQTYFDKVKYALTPDGVALVHTIGRTLPPATTGPFIRKYIFPGGYVPALSETMRAVEGAGLIPTDIEVWRLHYAETLRRWRQRFEAATNDAPARFGAKFSRMWRFYLVASELSFRLGTQVVFQIQLARRQDAVPLTRDYMAEGPETPLARTG